MPNRLLCLRSTKVQWEMQKRKRKKKRRRSVLLQFFSRASSSTVLLGMETWCNSSKLTSSQDTELYHVATTALKGSVFIMRKVLQEEDSWGMGGRKDREKGPLLT